MAHKKLFNEFPPVTTEAWESKIHEDLKGADYQKKLVWNTLENIPVNPYYREEDLLDKEYLHGLQGVFPSKNGTRKWWIRQDIVVEDIVKANLKALDAVCKGADSVNFVLNCKIADTISSDKKSFLALLNNINGTTTEVNFSTNNSPLEFLNLLHEYEKQQFPDTGIKGNLNYDPLGHLCIHGNFITNEQSEFNNLEEITRYAINNMRHFRVAGINAQHFQDAGASLVQELAFALSIGNQYLNILTNTGIPAEKAARIMHFTFATGSNYFMEIAKLRAARILWPTIVNAYSKDPGTTKIFIQAVSSDYNKTLYDPYVNMLRTTTETMSAIIGGADAITVKPFNSIFCNPGEFAERIARDTQIVLKDEAYLDKTIDPSAGAYYIENLTDAIASGAWELFKKVEKEGGFLEAFKKHFIQEQVVENALKREDAINRRASTLLGTNQYPDYQEVIKDKIDISILNQNQFPGKKQIAKPLVLKRGAETFEKIRLRTENNANGRPKVFLLTIGNTAMRRARANFSANFFACAGFEIIDNLGFSNTDEGVNKALKCHADIVVICSSDDEYAVFAPEILEKLQYKAILVIAGTPACMEELKAKGIQYFVHIKSNIIDSLTKFQELLNI